MTSLAISIPRVCGVVDSLTHSNSIRALMHDIDYQVAAADLILPTSNRVPLQKRAGNSDGTLDSDHKPLLEDKHLFGFDSMDEQTHEKINEEAFHLLEDIRPSLPIIKDFLLSLETELDDISNSRGIKTIINEDLLKAHNSDPKKEMKFEKSIEDLFYLLAIECQRNPDFRNELEISYEDPKNSKSSELLLLISNTLKDIRREYVLSNLGCEVKKND